MAAPVVLKIAQLEKCHQTKKRRFILHIPDFELHTGQFVTVTGPSGCGKSTLLDILALISQPTVCQTFWLVGKDQIDLCALHRRHAEQTLALLRREFIGYVLQLGGLLPYLSVADNLILPFRLLKRPVDSAAIEQQAERLAIRPLLSAYPHQLSGGERQRVAILRAFIHKPKIVLADEPTASVDQSRARQILTDLKTLAQSLNCAVVVVTHDVRLIYDLSDVNYSFTIQAASTTNATSDASVTSFCLPRKLSLTQ